MRNDFEKSLVLNQIPCYLFMFNNLIPVSYTHLDVYKRQVLMDT